jgi:hypothetical protein
LFEPGTKSSMAAAYSRVEEFEKNIDRMPEK